MEENLNSPEEQFDNNPQSDQPKKESLIINVEISSFLTETAKWAKFIAIIMFIMAGLMVLAGVVITVSGSVALQKYFPLGGMLGVIYIVVALIYYFPAKYLYDFASYIKQALYFNEQESLDYAFNRLKAHYRFIGILMIIALCLYIMVFIFAIIAGVLGSMIS